MTKKITTFSGRNIIVPQPLYDCKVSGYVRAMPFDGALQTLAAVNGLVAEKDASEVWTVYREPAAQHGSGRPVRRMSAGGSFQKTNCVDSLGRITAHIARGQVQDIILDLCGQLGLNFTSNRPSA